MNVVSTGGKCFVAVKDGVGAFETFDGGDTWYEVDGTDAERCTVSDEMSLTDVLSRLLPDPEYTAEQRSQAEMRLVFTMALTPNAEEL